MKLIMSDNNIDRGLQRFRARQGVGVGGFSGIWIARASTATRTQYARALRDIAADVLIAADALDKARSLPLATETRAVRLREPIARHGP
jgi:hypothetical protein